MARAPRVDAPSGLKVQLASSDLGVTHVLIRKCYRCPETEHDVLKPERCACGCRVYDPAAVLACAQKRQLDRAALSRARSARMRELRRSL